MEHLLKIVQMGIAPLRKTTIVFTLKVSKIGWNIPFYFDLNQIFGWNSR